MDSTEIISENASIKIALKKLIEILKKNDCYFDNNILITCKNGDLGVYAKQPIGTGSILISISERCLLPVEDLTLKLKGNNIVLTGYDPSLSSLRLDILHALINVFNLTDKIKHHNSSHPATLNGTSTALYNKLLEGRSASSDVYKTNNKNKSDISIQQMLKSRTMLYKRADKKSNKKTDVIMPVIDFFNHHIDAGPFTKSGTSFNNFKLLVSATAYNRTSREYYVKYGHFDAYDTFLRYGYVDQNVSFIYSIPMSITLPFFGTIIINCVTGKQHDGFNVNKNVAEFLYLAIPDSDNSSSLRLNLYSAIKKMGGKLTSDTINSYVQSAESMIINKNIEFYEELKSCIPAVPDDKTMNIISTATCLIDVQLTKLYSYPYL